MYDVWLECGLRGVSRQYHRESGRLAAWWSEERCARSGGCTGRMWCTGVQVKRWRIIVRNLPFGISEGDLIELLSPSGFVWTASIPKFADGKMKGFGFACFTCKAHAAAAIDAVNGKV